MSGRGCQRRKMMGRGADGGCGTEAKPCPDSRVTSNAAASTAARPTPGVSLYVQARKALSERSPFDESEALSRVDTLPVGLAAALVRSSEGRRKHRKAQAEGVKKAVQAPASRNVWTETEEYFRSITLADVDKLVARVPFGPDSALDSCLTVPLLRYSGMEETQGTFFTVVAESRNLSEACVDANETVDALKSETDDGVDAEQQQQRWHDDEQQKQQQVSEVDERRRHDGDRKEQQERQHESEHQQKQQATSISEHHLQHPDPACCVPTVKDEELVDYASKNWILASRNRTLLASERPNKKRKLLGSDAGLERVLLLPLVQGEGSPLCDYCCLGDYDSTSNRFLHCHACDVSVHMKCYGVHDVPQCAWFCSWCRQQEVGLKDGNHEGKDGRGPCFLCPKGGGALKPVETDMGGPTLKFAHLFCSLWMPELYVEDVEKMEPIMNAGKMQETRKRLVCSLCKVKQGTCIRCSHEISSLKVALPGTCRTSFHPICARGAKQRMEIWGKYKCDDVELRAFCSKHSSFQEIGSLQCHRSHATVLPDQSADGTDLSLASPVSRITKIRITQKESDKDTGQEDISSSSPGSVIKNEITSEHDELANIFLLDNSASLSNHNTLASGGSFDAAYGTSSEADGLLLIVKKLTDHGEISIADVASHIQISSGSLESALVGETTPIPDELKLKLMKWFHDHVHSDGPLKNLVSGRRLPNAEVGEDSAKDTSLTSFDAVVAKSLPLQRKIKSNVNLLKDKAVHLSEGAPIYQICNGKPLDKMVEDWLPENPVDALCEFPSHDQDSCGKGEVLRKEDASCSEDGSILHQQLCNEN